METIYPFVSVGILPYVEKVFEIVPIFVGRNKLFFLLRFGGSQCENTEKI